MQNEDLEDFEQCSICDGPLMLLGVLGNRKHMRCRNCGMDFSKEIPNEERAILSMSEEDDD
jgi:hypothetical protein